MCRRARAHTEARTHARVNIEKLNINSIVVTPKCEHVKRRHLLDTQQNKQYDKDVNIVHYNLSNDIKNK